MTTPDNLAAVRFAFLTPRALPRPESLAGRVVVLDIAFAAMVDAFGSDIRKRIVKSLITHWTSDPWSRGGYSHCLPGRAASRLAFGDPVGGRIFFAGEHCSIDFFSTIHGAHLSGLAAAQQAMTAAA